MASVIELELAGRIRLGLTANATLHRVGGRKRFDDVVAKRGFCSYNNLMRVTYDAAKRARTLADRGLDFEDAAVVFKGTTIEIEDTRKDYGERRIICYGILGGRIVVVGYTPRGPVRHICSMRKANHREQARLAPYFEIRSDSH